MKVSELNPPELDYWVAKIEYPKSKVTLEDGIVFLDRHDSTGINDTVVRYGGIKCNYSEKWRHGGPLIEKYNVFVGPHGDGVWGASRKGEHGSYDGYGPTPLIASMRCIVSSVYGENVDISNE